MNQAFHNSDAAQPWTRFLSCLDAYGAQRSLWPELDRVLYDQFGITLAGEQALQAARGLDALLTDAQAADETFDVTPAFRQRLQTMPLPPQQRGASYLVVMWKRSAFLLLLMAALGFGNGYIDNSDLTRLANGTMTTAFGVGTAP